MATEDKTLEQNLEELLEVESFDPPEAFVKDALVTDDGLYDEAESDYKGFWEKQAEALDWESKWDTVLNEENPPFYKWFEGGTLNVAHNCVDRHVDAGNGDRVAFHWYGPSK